MRKSFLLVFVLFLTTFFILPGCATIFGHKYNTLVLESESQPAAKVYIDNKYIGDAPGKLRVEKKVIQHGSKLEVRAEGYKTVEYLLIRKQHPLYTIADVLSTVGVGLLVDYATGNIYRPIPRKFSYQLEKIN